MGRKVENFIRFQLGEIYKSQKKFGYSFIIDFVDIDKTALCKSDYQNSAKFGLHIISSPREKIYLSSYKDLKALALSSYIKRYNFIKKGQLEENRKVKIQIFRDTKTEYCAALYLIDSQGRKL